ncbi:hypothetical protein [Deinococcus planocerae]|nr:hypothetical protein [Deinococcus planocerae]
MSTGFLTASTLTLSDRHEHERFVHRPRSAHAERVPSKDGS